MILFLILCAGLPRAALAVHTVPSNMASTGVQPGNYTRGLDRYRGQHGNEQAPVNPTVPSDPGGNPPPGPPQGSAPPGPIENNSPVVPPNEVEPHDRGVENHASPTNAINTTDGNIARDHGKDIVPPTPPPSWDWGWLVPWLIGGLVALAGVVFAARRLPNDGKSPPPPPAVTVGRAFRPDEGRASAEGIGIDGPEVRLGGRLEPGRVLFNGDEPVVEREEPDD